MKKTKFYLIATLVACLIFYAGIKNERYRTLDTMIKKEEPVTYSLFEQEELLTALVTKPRSVDWGEAAVDSILSMYGKLNKNIQTEDYPEFMKTVWQDFGSDTGETNTDYDMFKMAMYRFQYLYLNNLCTRLPNALAKEKMSAVITAWNNWEKTLVSLFSNNVQLGACGYRYYTFECASISQDALENLCMVLYWLDYKQKGKEPDMVLLTAHERWMELEDYHDNIRITEERLKEMREIEEGQNALYYIPAFDGETDKLLLTPEIGERIFNQEDRMWNILCEAVRSYAETIVPNKKGISDLDEYMIMARYNALHTVANIG